MVLDQNIPADYVAVILAALGVLAFGYLLFLRVRHPRAMNGRRLLLLDVLLLVAALEILFDHLQHVAHIMVPAFWQVLAWTTQGIIIGGAVALLLSRREE